MIACQSHSSGVVLLECLHCLQEALSLQTSMACVVHAGDSSRHTLPPLL